MGLTIRRPNASNAAVRIIEGRSAPVTVVRAADSASTPSGTAMATAHHSQPTRQRMSRAPSSRSPATPGSGAPRPARPPGDRRRRTTRTGRRPRRPRTRDEEAGQWVATGQPDLMPSRGWWASAVSRRRSRQQRAPTGPQSNASSMPSPPRNTARCDVTERERDDQQDPAPPGHARVIRTRTPSRAEPTSRTSAATFRPRPGLGRPGSG